MNATVRIRIFGVFLCLVLAGVMAGPASAVTTFNMVAGQTTLTMPGGAVVTMWGFSLTSTDVNGTVTPGDGIVKVPGDPLVVPPGETTVTISLTNNLPEPVSLMILGQRLAPAGGPVWTDGLGNTVSATQSRTAGDFTSRIRSFAHETPTGGVATYTWTNFKAGTYLLQSGTNPAKQVQMGLYAAIKMDSAAGQAYAGVPYSKELILVYSEIDPLIHAAVAGGTYGPSGTITSSLQRKPKYFLVNGMAFETGGGLDPLNALTALGTDDRVLLRFINAGYILHVPELVNMYMSVVAEDGNPFAYPKMQYSLEMPAGKTFDAIVKPVAEGTFPLYDAALHLTNAGSAADGGMLAYLDIALVDTDGDGVVDNADNCTLIGNADQRDTNSDGFGNRCDADLDNNGITSASDIAIFRTVLGTNDPDADFDGNGIVSASDIAIFRSFLGQPPGPSGVAP